MAVKMNAARLEGPEEKCAVNLTYSGHRATARIVAQISAGRKPAAVHTASPNRTRASTTRTFMRAPAPKGRGLLSVLAAASVVRSDGRVLDAAEPTLPAIRCPPCCHDKTAGPSFGSRWEQVASELTLPPDEQNHG